MRLSELLTEQRVTTTLRATTKDAALEALAALLVAGQPTLDRASVLRVLRDREGLASTGVGDEVAIPHGRIVGASGLLAAVALSPSGVEFDSIDHRPVKIFVAILAPDNRPKDQLSALARVSKLLRDGRVRARLMQADSPAALLAAVRDEESLLP